MKNLFIWIAGFLSEDAGKASQKRLISLSLTMVICYMLISSYRHGTTIDIYLLITVFGFIASLLGMTYIPTRKQDVSAQDSK